MYSLAELAELTGFFSYSREDDNDSAGALSALRDRIRRELRGQLGRKATGLKIFQDTVAIPYGSQWERKIKDAIAQAVFFIPIITPTAVNSRYCKNEFELFLTREAELGREDLVFPILYIRVHELESEDQRRQNDVLEIIHARQYADWTKYRRQDVNSPEFGNEIDQFCQDIVKALKRPWLSPEERRRQEEEERRRQQDEEQRRKAAEAEAKWSAEMEGRTDYYPLIAKAVSGLENSTPEARLALYGRARSGLVAQLRGVTPALGVSDITLERLALEEAIRKVEAEAKWSAETEGRTDYYPLIAKAVSELEESTRETRGWVYDRARSGLVAQLRGVWPPLTESDITRQRLALEEAIRKTEAEAARRSRNL
jgi:hypothetical protein